MAIKDLQPRQGNVEVVGEITEIGDIREFQKFGKTGRVATAILKDETGEIKLSLWNEQIDNLKVGDKVHITNGYVNEWQGEPQLTTGKFGKLEVLESKEKETTAKKEEKEIEEETEEVPEEKKKEDLEQEVEEEMEKGEEELEKEVQEEDIDIGEEIIE